MELERHDLPTLFSQLGLPSTPAGMATFIAAHRLPEGVALADASFWSPSQADFLRQALAADAEWSEAIDELATRLA